MTATGRQALAVAGREFWVEAVTREASVSVLPFIAALVILAGVGFGADPRVLAVVAPGLVWLVVLVAAVPLAPAISVSERQDGCWELLRALVSPTALLLGKLVALWAWLLTCWATAAALAVFLLGAQWTAWSLPAGITGALGVAVLVVLLGTLLGGATRRAGLLATLLLPASLPVLLAASQAMTPGVPGIRWLALLVGFDALVITLAWALFPTLLEE